VRDLDDLRVVKATADGGPSMKRVSPRAMGRAFFIKHRTSHLTIGVSDEVNVAMAPPPARLARATRQAPPAAPAKTADKPAKGQRTKVPAKGKASGKAESTKAGDKKPARTAKGKEKK
jgi:hypothetical protein